MNILRKRDNQLVCGLLVCERAKRCWWIGKIQWNCWISAKVQRFNGFVKGCLSTHSATVFAKNIKNQVGNKYHKTRFRSHTVF